MNFDGDQQYRVVVNHEEQYSIWPDDMENAIGWRDAGACGTKEYCLEYIAQVWTDMRPLSLRKAMREFSDAADVARQDSFIPTPAKAVHASATA